MSVSPVLLFSLLLTLAFSMGTLLQPVAQSWTRRQGTDNLIQVMLGDGRRILANHMFVQADVYFHSGYYPSIFDQQFAPTNSSHMTGGDHKEAGHDESHDAHVGEGHDEDEHEKAMAFLGQPRDWIERFGRKFTITKHAHLEHGREGEMLPWLRISAELDPERVDTYTVSAYWLCSLGKTKEAELFLRDGLRANPDSYDILFELGRVYEKYNHDPNRARNVWQAAFAKWNKVEAQKEKPDLLGLGPITTRLAKLEQEQGNYAAAIKWLEITLERKASPSPASIEKQITELRQKMSAKGD